MGRPNNYFKGRRKRLMEKDPHCHWCRRLLKEYPNFRGGHFPEDYPTIDHLKSRLLGPRKDVGMKRQTLVLACPECNMRRQQEDHRKHLFVARWKAGAFPRKWGLINILLRWCRNSLRKPKNGS